MTLAASGMLAMAGQERFWEIATAKAFYSG